MPSNPFSSGPKGYKSKQAPQYETGAIQGIANRAGAGVSYDKKGNPVYDFSRSFSPIGGAEGVRKATAGFDTSGIDDAAAGFRKPTRMSQTYAPARFSFKGLPGQYGASAYQAQAGNIRREGAGALEKSREAVGVRRPGLLMKMAEDFNRQQGERLATADADINRYVMDKGVDLGVQEQMGNADQRYKGYQSRADLEQRNAEEKFRYLQGLMGAGQAKVGTQSQLLENERAYNDAPLQYLQQLFGTAAGINNQSAQIAAQNRASTLNFLGGLAGAV